MIEHSQLIEISKASLWIATMQILSQLKHIIGVTALWSVDILNEILASLLAGEVFTTAVATKGQRTFARNNIPEVCSSCVISLIATKFGYTLKTYNLRYLSIGVHIVETIATSHQWVEQSAMRESLSYIQILLIASDCICIGQHLVHATVLSIQHSLHLSISQAGSQVDSPITKAQEELFGLLIAAISPCVAQSCIHLVYIIERYPCAIVSTKVALLKVAPHTIAAWHTTYIAFSPGRVILGICIGTSLQFADPVFHTLAALFITSSGIDSHSCKIVSAHVSVKSVPVGIRLTLRC